jgi:hypothetical protein
MLNQEFKTELEQEEKVKEFLRSHKKIGIRCCKLSLKGTPKWPGLNNAVILIPNIGRLFTQGLSKVGFQLSVSLSEK